MNAGVANRLYYSLQYARREPVREALNDLMQSMYHDVDALKAIQSKRLIELLRYSIVNVPFYKERFSPFGSAIKKAESWDEVQDVMNDLPPTTKEDYLESKEMLKSRYINSIPTAPNITSGSTGNPVYFLCDKRSWAYRHAAVFRVMQLYGVDVGEPYAYFFGLHWSKQRQIKVRLRDIIFNRVRVSAFDIRETTFSDYLRDIRRARTTHWVGYPSAIFEFCSLAKSRGIDVPRQKAVFTTAEPLFPHQRDLIEEICGCRCINIYGSVEGGLTAFEGPEGCMHLSMENTHLMTDARNAIYVTDLFLYANPFIKYRVGDECSPHTFNPSTKLHHTQIGFVFGRSGKPIVLPDGRQVNANLPSYIFKNMAAKGRIRRYQFCQYKDRIYLFVAANGRLSMVERESLMAECSAAFGNGLDVSLLEVTEIAPGANAKHMDYVILQDEAEFESLMRTYGELQGVTH